MLVRPPPSAAAWVPSPRDHPAPTRTEPFCCRLWDAVRAFEQHAFRYATSPDGLGWFTAGVLVMPVTLVVAVAWARRLCALAAHG